MDPKIIEYIVGPEHSDEVRQYLSGTNNKEDIRIIRKAGYWFNDKSALAGQALARSILHYKDHFPKIYEVVTDDNDSFHDDGISASVMSPVIPDNEFIKRIFMNVMDLKESSEVLKKICEATVITFQSDLEENDEDMDSDRLIAEFEDAVNGILDSTDSLNEMVSGYVEETGAHAKDQQKELSDFDKKLIMFSSTDLWKDKNSSYEDLVKEVAFTVPVFKKTLQNILQLKEVMLTCPLGDRYIDVEKFKETDKVISGYRCDPVSGIQVCLLNRVGEMFFETPPTLYDVNEIPSEDNMNN